jgi:hypothetical protein
MPGPLLLLQRVARHGTRLTSPKGGAVLCSTLLRPLVLPLLFVAHAPFPDSRSGRALHGGPSCCFGCSRTPSLGASARSGRGGLCKRERSCKSEGRRQRDNFKSHGRFLLVVVQE